MTHLTHRDELWLGSIGIVLHEDAPVLATPAELEAARLYTELLAARTREHAACVESHRNRSAFLWATWIAAAYFVLACIGWWMWWVIR